ncbi:hypothetical protein Y032_0045g1201 [Ancylostoma ceylanicum]|uniref:Uncharacterized protein n=1 Tax=Ancylostoma ceylanicum TaxID=53326 RepID=A0A016UCW1_9BILA|nr:hypothetical protein Y032_0045g1201 [Ancylostoma ceylanicum]
MFQSFYIEFLGWWSTMATESQTNVNKRKVTVYTKDTYNRVETITQSSPSPQAVSQVPMLQKDEKLSPIMNPQVHNVNTTVDNKVVDGQFVRTEKQVEEAMKENLKQRVEEVKH